MDQDTKKLIVRLRYSETEIGTTIRVVTSSGRMREEFEGVLKGKNVPCFELDGSELVLIHLVSGQDVVLSLEDLEDWKEVVVVRPREVQIPLFPEEPFQMSLCLSE